MQTVEIRTLKRMIEKFISGKGQVSKIEYSNDFNTLFVEVKKSAQEYNFEMFNPKSFSAKEIFAVWAGGF